MERRRVVITGVGAITPLGNNVNEFWNSLLEGISGADFITHFDASKFKTKFACEVKTSIQLIILIEKNYVNMI